MPLILFRIITNEPLSEIHMLDIESLSNHAKYI